MQTMTIEQWAAETVTERLENGATDAGHDLSPDDVAHLRSACGADVDLQAAAQAVADEAESRAALTERNATDHVTYTATDDGGSQMLEATTWEEACEAAREWARGGYESESATYWVHVWLRASDETTASLIHVEIEPHVPDCADGHEHDWVTPEWLGGAVRGHGGGVISTDACRHCGCKRVTNTWAQCRDCGDQGRTSESYTEDEYVDEFREVGEREADEAALMTEDEVSSHVADCGTLYADAFAARMSERRSEEQ